jgi:hypothetical protein
MPPYLQVFSRRNTVIAFSTVWFLVKIAEHTGVMFSFWRRRSAVHVATFTPGFEKSRTDTGTQPCVCLLSILVKHLKVDDVEEKSIARKKGFYTHPSSEISAWRLLLLILDTALQRRITGTTSLFEDSSNANSVLCRQKTSTVGGVVLTCENLDWEKRDRLSICWLLLRLLE